MLRRYAPLRRCTRPRPVALKPKRRYIEDQPHREWIHTQPCILHDGRCGQWVEMHHVGRPRNDHPGVPLCATLHRGSSQAVHQIGRRPFEERFGISFEAAILGLSEEYEPSDTKRTA